MCIDECDMQISRVRLESLKRTVDVSQSFGRCRQKVALDVAVYYSCVLAVVD